MSAPNEPADLVDEFYRPYIRALGKLVITFALCEAALLSMVAELCSGDEGKAVAILKAENAKDQVISLVRSSGMSGYDLDETVIGLGEFWCDKEHTKSTDPRRMVSQPFDTGRDRYSGIDAKEGAGRGFQSADGARGLGISRALRRLRRSFFAP